MWYLSRREMRCLRRLMRQRRRMGISVSRTFLYSFQSAFPTPRNIIRRRFSAISSEAGLFESFRETRRRTASLAGNGPTCTGLVQPPYQPELYKFLWMGCSFTVRFRRAQKLSRGKTGGPHTSCDLLAYFLVWISTPQYQTQKYQPFQVEMGFSGSQKGEKKQAFHL